MHTIAQITTSRNTYPEAPCSLNAHVEVAGLRVQVTGRGATPAEATANFRGTLAALQAPVVPDRMTQLSTLLACGLRKATEAGDNGLVERLIKATALVLADKVALGNRPGCVAVWSQTNPETYYEVDGKLCTCPDSQHHQERVCKHVLAAALWQRLA